MTQTRFTSIGLVGHPRHHNALATHHQLYQWLSQQGIEVIIEQQLAKKLTISDANVMPLEELAQRAQLAIVVGGDGNMLHVARTFAQHDILVIGVNRGNLGFLTDLTPEHLLEPLSEVLNGQYQLEPRFLLEAQIHQGNQTVRSGLALNEMVLHPGKMVHMIDFDVYIDGQLAFSQRADGLIIATPTGSTAYALSAGGPIVDPALNVITLVPMFAHSLSARPLIIGSESHICLQFAKQTRDLLLSCDSQLNLPIHANQQVTIQRYAKPLKLIHPCHYNYFTTLRSKLGWAQKLF